MKAPGMTRPMMSCVDVMFPAVMPWNRFSGQVSGSPKTTRPPEDELLPESLLPLPPPQAVSAIAPAMPVAISAAWRLLNFTCDASLVPRARGERTGRTGAGLRQPCARFHGKGDPSRLAAFSERRGDPRHGFGEASTTDTDL